MYLCSRRDMIAVECLEGMALYLSRISNSLMMASTEGPKHVGVIDQ